MNKVIMIGRMTKEAEVRNAANGKSVTRIVMAVDKPFPNESGGYDADFFPVIIWGTAGEYLAKRTGKASNIMVEGRLQNRSYDGKDGAKHYISEIICQHYELLDHNKKTNPAKETAVKQDVNEIWESLSNIPVKKDEDGNIYITEEWNGFPSGTRTEVIETWLQEKYNVIIKTTDNGKTIVSNS